MKVLIIAHNTKPTSGWGRHAAMVLDEYDKRGIDYCVVTEIGQAYHRPLEEQLLLAPNSPLVIVRNMWRIWHTQHGKYDVVHAFDVWPYGLYGLTAVLGTKAKLFLNGVGTYSVAPLYAPFKKRMLHFVFRRASKIFCVSNYTMKEMLKPAAYLKDKFILAPLGSTDLPEPSNIDIEHMKSAFQISGSPVILTVGAIKERKGQLDTLKAIEILKKQYPNILYLLVGSSGDIRYVESLQVYARENQLESNLRILDSIKNDQELAALYELSDVFAMNSNSNEATHHFEGFGLVFLEAYQFGKPAVGSRGCGIEDAIEDGVTGYLSNQSDPKDIAEKINLIIERGPVSFASSVREMRNRFRWDALANLFLREYREAV